MAGDRASFKKIGGKYDVETINLFNANVNALAQKIDCMNVHTVGISHVYCEICGLVMILLSNFN